MVLYFEISSMFTAITATRMCLCCPSITITSPHIPVNSIANKALCRSIIKTSSGRSESEFVIIRFRHFSPSLFNGTAERNMRTTCCCFLGLSYESARNCFFLSRAAYYSSNNNVVFVWRIICLSPSFFVPYYILKPLQTYTPTVITALFIVSKSPTFIKRKTNLSLESLSLRHKKTWQHNQLCFMVSQS